MNLQFDHVAKSYGSINALKDITFSINDGEFIFLVGPSGAGKSTILKLILNQIRPTSGAVRIDEMDLAVIPRKKIEKIRCKIGVIFQDYQLIVDKTVEENIALALDIVEYPKSQIASRVDHVLNLVNLSTRRHLFPNQLSGGEMQRTSLARAVAVEPGLILADEPTGNLDPENSWNLVKLLKEINEKTGTTILMTTHNYDIVNSLNNRVITVKNGEVVSDTHPVVGTKAETPVVKKTKKRKKKKIKISKANDTN